MEDEGSDKTGKQVSDKVKISLERTSGAEASRKKHVRAENSDPVGKDLYESIMDGITSGVWVSDSNDVIYDANMAMEMIAGVTQQRLVGRGVFRDFAENVTGYFMLH